MKDQRNPPSERPIPSSDLARMAEGILYGMALGKKLLGKKRIVHHAQLVAILILIRNEADGKSTECKEVIAETEQAMGTARGALASLEASGLAEISRRVGRTPLFRPTARLIARLERWRDEASDHLA